MNNFSPRLEKVGQMYDLIENQKEQEENKILVDYGEHYHLGYWDETNLNASPAEAADHLTQVMLDKVIIQAGQRFCDLGCGVGVPGIQLAQATGCLVDGITISQSQYEKAQQLAAKARLSDPIHFILGNALGMPCAEATYDGGWFFESIFHMGHREALQEAYRILKPGATLLIADITAKPTINQELKAFSEEYSSAFFITKEEYPELLDTAGFDLIEIDNVTKFVITPSIPKFAIMCKQYESELMQYFNSLAMKDKIQTYYNQLGRQYVESEVLDHWIQMNQSLYENIEYILVTAQKRGELRDSSPNS